MGKIKNKSKPLQALIAALFAVLLACTPAIAMADMARHRRVRLARTLT